MKRIDIMDPNETGLITTNGLWVRYLWEYDENNLVTKTEVIYLNSTGSKIDYYVSLAHPLSYPVEVKITHQEIVSMLLSYLKDHTDIEDLIKWSHNWIFSNYVRTKKPLSIIKPLAKIGACKFDGFKLKWDDYEMIFQQLGYELKLDALIINK